MISKLSVFLISAALCAFFYFSPRLLHAQQSPKRLILKDGSYQLVVKWEIKDGRVRYYSAEREDWEEVPNALIDWDATNKYEQDHAAEVAAKAHQLSSELQQEEDINKPEVAPGLRLEDATSAYLLSNVEGREQLIQMHQTDGYVDSDQKKAVLHFTISPVNQFNIFLPVSHAATQVHSPLHFYVNSGDKTYLDINQTVSADEIPAQTQTASSPQKIKLPWNRFLIMDLQSRPDKRIVVYIIEPTALKKLTGNWVEVTPIPELVPGEYALIERVSENSIRLSMWDFGVHAKNTTDEIAPPTQPDAPTLLPPPTLQKR